MTLKFKNTNVTNIRAPFSIENLDNKTVVVSNKVSPGKKDIKHFIW